MKLDALSISIGILLVPAMLIALFHLLVYLKNRDRYAIPKFLPRDDEVIWAMVMSNPGRIWSLPNTVGLKCKKWDLGIFEFDSTYDVRYKTSPMVTDVIIAPRKWGGDHALVITQVFPPEGNRYQLVATYVGEYVNEKIKSGRTDVNRQPISVS